MKHYYSAFFKKMVLALLTLFLINNHKAKACYATFTHTNACANDTVWFYAQDLYAIYTWDFGDSTGATNINHDTATFHVYTQPGTYFVSLFVNIGAEWDYQTQIITVGSSCFNADFSYTCSGQGYVNFTNQSIGNTSSYWDFGDPSSGSDNYSSSSDPYHFFATPGVYSVTLYAYSGTNADTIVQQVIVQNSCFGGTIYGSNTQWCAGELATFSTSFGGNTVSTVWNFGDPGSGNLNTSTDINGSHQYDSAGCYLVTLIFSDGTFTDTLFAAAIVQDCNVWPGDANADGEVNAEDIFPIGMYYAAQGTPRNNPSGVFASQSSIDWPNYENFMYLQRLVNMKMADCNGDGVVNTSDLATIQTNYGRRHNNHNNRSSMPEATLFDPLLSINLPVNSSVNGATISATIDFGGSGVPVSNLYGLAFSINYNPALVVPGSMNISLASNWLGDSSNELQIVKDDFVNGHIDAALVRKDKLQIAVGQGQIGTLTFQLRNAVFGNLDLSISPSAKALSTTIYPSTTASNTEIFLPIRLQGDMLTVISPVGMSENPLSSRIHIFPNPASEALTIRLDALKVNQVSISNAVGQELMVQNGTFDEQFSISLNELAPGSYFISLKTNEGRLVSKISKQ